VCLQQYEATEALRAALGRIEAALMAREQKLADSWKVLRAHADGLRSSSSTGTDTGLLVSFISQFSSQICRISPEALQADYKRMAVGCAHDCTVHLLRMPVV
jgi:hypothetical protein